MSPKEVSPANVAGRSVRWRPLEVLHRTAGHMLTGTANALRPRLSLGARLVAFDAQGRVFLVRHSYIPGLHFPGGAVDAGETCREAVIREAREEGGLEFDDLPELFQIYRSAGSPGRDHLVLFVVRGVRQARPQPPNLEIIASGFHHPDDLPAGATAGTRRRLEEIEGGLAPADTW